MNKKLLIILAVFIVFVLVLPSLIVIPFSDEHKTEATSANQKKQTAKPLSKEIDPNISVAVYRSQSKSVEDLPMHNYLVGVVASEMPAQFNIEALKAQALTARTYIVNHLLNKDKADLPKDAVVGDSTMYQVFKDKKQLKKIWGADYDWKMKKINKAVSATAGQIITYKGKPITASFFSTSNGYTENSGSYWQNDIPYLKSVPSPWDKNSPKYLNQVSMPVSTVEQDLGIQIQKESGTIGTILKRTEGHRVDTFKIGGKTFTGRTIREKLQLSSTDFNMKRNGDTLIITTKGNGHGVGMSQYGAEGLAKQGKNYKQIVEYYYTGVKVSKLSPFVAKLTAKK